MDKTKPQLYINKVGKIVTFKDKATGNRYYILKKDLQAILFGGKKYNYANVYVPYKTVKELVNKDLLKGDLQNDHNVNN